MLGNGQEKKKNNEKRKHNVRGRFKCNVKRAPFF